MIQPTTYPRSQIFDKSKMLRVSAFRTSLDLGCSVSFECMIASLDSIEISLVMLVCGTTNLKNVSVPAAKLDRKADAEWYNTLVCPGRDDFPESVWVPWCTCEA
jgi:hypothetical protein